MKSVIDSGADKQQIKEAANEIRLKLNPHPAGQLEHNVPMVEEEAIGMQHKICRETVLFLAKLVMLTALFVLGGRNLLGWKVF